MEKLNEREKYFDYKGILMPKEFSEVCQVSKFQDIIFKRKQNPFRFFKHLDNYLKRVSGKSVYEYCTIFKYPKYLRDLFYMNELGYKNVYSEEYKSFFENVSQKEKEKKFTSADYGARTIFEYEQDVVASNVLEDIVAYNSLGGLMRNPNASNDSEINSQCDFLYKTPENFSDTIELPIELKTKWNFNKNLEIRGGINSVVKSKGFILCVFINDKKYALIDPLDENLDITRGELKYGKIWDTIHLNKDDLKDLDIWNKEDMRNLMNDIYKMNKKRG